jgi:peptidoglycan/xylan/chitin deacetylase (PgdA/CDA1 family)
MRRFFQFCGTILLALIVFSGSTITFSDSMPVPATPGVVPSPTPRPVTDDDGPNHAVIEYGWPAIIKHNNDPFHAYIRFPQGGNPTDNVIYSWAHDLCNTVLKEFQEVLIEDPRTRGEVNVHFDSYLIDNRYAGILQQGKYSVFFDPSVPPVEVVKTFNIDLSRNIFLESNDILDFSQSFLILELTRERMLIEHPNTERYLGFIDESWLRHLVIGHEGIIVVLDKNRLLPDDFPTLTVTLPYEDIGDALLIRKNPPLDYAPSPSPSPSPIPTATPDDDPSVPPQSGNINAREPMIALSFDDGPGLYTEQFLDLLEEYGVRATFCVVGNLVNTHTDALKRAVSLGNEVIGHSWDHKNLAKLSAGAVRAQILDTAAVIEEVTGTDVMMFRPPYGAVSDTMRDVAQELGFSIIYWSVDPEDWNTDDPDAVFNSVMQQIKDGAIILSHEIHKSTLIAYQRLIPQLLLRGFQFVTVSELLSYRVGELTPGEVYYNGHHS